MIKGAGMMTEPDDPRWRKKTHPSFDDNDPFSDVRTDVCRFSQTRKTFSPSPSGFATRMRYPHPRPVVRPPTIMVVVVRKTPLVVLPRTAAALWLHYYIRYPLMPDGAFRTMLHRCVYCRIIIAWLEDKSESA